NSVKHESRTDITKAKQQSIGVSLLVNSYPTPPERLTDMILPRFSSAQIVPPVPLEISPSSSPKVDRIIIRVNPNCQRRFAEREENLVHAPFFMTRQHLLQEISF